MHEMQVFHNENFGRIRGFLDDGGNSWFVATDVCIVLDLSNPHSSLALLDGDEKGLHTVETLGGQQELLVISEPGLYSLILRSRKPEAKVFKRWITHEVIPAIRKTGEYKISEAPPSASKLDDYANLRCYVMVLRHLACQTILPPAMRVRFLAEAASILSGHPVSCYLPLDNEPQEDNPPDGGPLPESQEGWEQPSAIARRYGLSNVKIGQFLKSAGLHGSQDDDHAWSRPIFIRAIGGREIVSFLYDPEVIQPYLEKHLADLNGALFN